MTGLDRPVVRETRHIDHRTRKPWVVKLEAGGRVVKMRVKGERRSYTVTYDQIAKLGAANLAAQIRAEKATKRAERRKAKREVERGRSR